MQTKSHREEERDNNKSKQKNKKGEQSLRQMNIQESVFEIDDDQKVTKVVGGAMDDDNMKDGNGDDADKTIQWWR